MLAHVLGSSRDGAGYRHFIDQPGAGGRPPRIRDSGHRAYVAHLPGAASADTKAIKDAIRELTPNSSIVGSRHPLSSRLRHDSPHRSDSETGLNEDAPPIPRVLSRTGYVL